MYVEGGLIYRNTKDYIQRNIQDLSGGKENATYTNYGKVVTKGITCRHVTVFPSGSVSAGILHKWTYAIWKNIR